MVWYSHRFKNFPQFVVTHTVKGFSVVNEAEVDVSLEFAYFFCDPADVSNLISGSSAFSKTSLNLWKFTDGPSGWQFWNHLYDTQGMVEQQDRGNRSPR